MRTPVLAACIPLLVAAVAVPAWAQRVVPLFNGRDLAGWTTLNGRPAPQAWKVQDGQLHLDRRAGRGGHILHERMITGDFELHFDWKVAAKGNSGIKYRVRSYGRQLLGCEFQLLDDQGHPNGRNPRTSAGALYGLFAPAPEKKLQPLDRFNTSRIVVRGQRLSHWLNDVRIVDVEVGGPEWQRQIRRSKFSDKPGFGANAAGRVMLQDHGSDVWFKRIDLLFADKVAKVEKVE